MNWELHSSTESLRKHIGNLRQDIVNIFRSQRRFMCLVRENCATNELWEKPDTLLSSVLL